ncbi:MAG: hypothetical protein V4604_12255 [Bacteroidota bacterium]
MSQSYLQTIRSYYPKAFYAGTLEKEILEYLKRVGFKPGEVMAANSVCSDDVNAMQFSITDTGLLGPFYLGGLDGFPFTGLTGIQAFAHHMPEEGALLIYFGPHIGITEKGGIGKIRRIGQDHDSDCCGAAQAALKKLNDQPKPPTLLDYQQDNIVTLFQMHKQRIETAIDPIQEATEVMYEAIAERIHLLIDHSRDTFKGKHAILIGSVFINVDEGSEACVDQRLFQTINLKTGEVVSHKEKFEEYLAARTK